jgi:hypothetical protein
LNPTSSDQRISAVFDRTRGDQRELPHLVPAKPERNGIVALDEETRAAAKRLEQPGQRLDRRRRRHERQRGQA